MLHLDGWAARRRPQRSAAASYAPDRQSPWITARHVPLLVQRGKFVQVRGRTPPALSCLRGGYRRSMRDGPGSRGRDAACEGFVHSRHVTGSAADSNGEAATATATVKTKPVRSRHTPCG